MGTCLFELVLGQLSPEGVKFVLADILRKHGLDQLAFFQDEQAGSFIIPAYQVIGARV